MIIFALIVLAAIVGGYVYFSRCVGKSVPMVPPTVPAPANPAPNSALAGDPGEPNKTI